MKLSIILRTQEFRGDHSADISIAFSDELKDQTLQSLVTAIGTTHGFQPSDVLEIRQILAIDSTE